LTLKLIFCIRDTPVAKQWKPQQVAELERFCYMSTPVRNILDWK